MKYILIITLIVLLVCVAYYLGALDDSCIRGRTTC